MLRVTDADILLNLRMGDKGKKINAKTTASVLLSIDMGLFQDFHDVQENCSYILVYNEEKYPPSAQTMDDFYNC